MRKLRVSCPRVKKRKGWYGNSRKVKESITFPRHKSFTLLHQSLRETVKMIANSKEQKGSRSSRRIGRRTCLAGVTISLFLCISGIALCAVLITFVALRRECPSCPSFVSEDLKSVWIFMGVAYSLLISGGCIIVILTFRDRRINSPDGSFPEEVEILLRFWHKIQKIPPHLFCHLLQSGQ